MYNTQIPEYQNNTNQAEAPGTNYLRSKGLEALAQRYRVIYGCAQIIPPHSTMFDSGTIQATQQIYSYRDTSSVSRTFGDENGVEGDVIDSNFTNSSLTAIRNDSNGGETPTYLFGPEDFPGPTDSIQNPKALYSRYKTGAYMPYKLVNPLVFPPVSTETRRVHTAPFHVIGAYFRRGAYVHNSAGDTDTRGPWIAMNWTGSAFVSSETGTISTAYVYAYALECVSYTGMRFFFHVQAVQNAVATATANQNVTINFANTKYLQCYNGVITAVAPGFCTYPTSLINGSRVHAASAGALSSTEWNELTDLQVQNVGVFNFRSINLAAAINVQIRIGVEMMVVAGSAYSPFKHISPAYDTASLNAYCSIIRQVRDAYTGDVGSGENRNSFRAFLASLIETYERGPVSNTGARWQGPTGTF